MKKPSDTLSVFLSVYNGASTLARRVTELLEVLPDLTWQFEIVILDNGSTDDTEDVAYDLERNYPQLRLVRRRRRETEAKVLAELALDNTSSDVVIVADEASPLLTDQLRYLWETRHDASPPVRTDSTDYTVVDRLKCWAAELPSSRRQADDAAVRMICRRLAGSPAYRPRGPRRPLQEPAPPVAQP